MSCSRGRTRRAWAPPLSTSSPHCVTALLTLLVLVGACHSGPSVERLPRPHDAPRTDPVAREAFLALVTRSSQAVWWVDSTFVRTVAGRTLRSQLTEVNRPPDHVVVGAGGATGVLHGKPLECTRADGGAVCTGGAAAATADVGALARLTDAGTGGYALRVAAARSVAGLAARCFRMDWNSRDPSQPYGRRATLCYSNGGVPLAREVERADGNDRIRADTVRREVNDAALEALVAPYAGVGPVRPLPPGTSVAPAVP